MKSAKDVVSQLEAISGSSSFTDDTRQLFQGWNSEQGFGARAVIEGVLGFMESHPEIEFGNPGPLVHHLEQFSLEFYVPLLSASIERAPTEHTLWMLNRIINGIGESPWRTSLVEILRGVAGRADVSAAVRAEASSYLEHQGAV